MTPLEAIQSGWGLQPSAATLSSQSWDPPDWKASHHHLCFQDNTEGSPPGPTLAPTMGESILVDSLHPLLSGTGL